MYECNNTGVMVLLVWVYCKGQFLYFFRGQFFVVIKKAAVLATFFSIVYSKLHTCLLMVNLFESSFTCVPICLFFTGSQLRCIACLVGYSSGGHLTTSSFDVICFANVQESSWMPLHKQACSDSFLLLPARFLGLVGQALTRLVTVSSMCYHTSTSALSTSSSSRGFTS